MDRGSVPSSGTLTWKSLSTSSRKASNSASARSISSMSRTVGCLAQNGLEQRALEQKTHGEEDIFFLGQTVGGVGQRRRVGERFLQFVAQQLGVEQLLGVFPLVERLGFVQSFVTLQADQLAAGGAGDGLGQFSLADARRPFGQQWFAQLLARYTVVAISSLAMYCCLLRACFTSAGEA